MKIYCSGYPTDIISVLSEHMGKGTWVKCTYDEPNNGHSTVWVRPLQPYHESISNGIECNIIYAPNPDYDITRYSEGILRTCAGTPGVIGNPKYSRNVTYTLTPSSPLEFITDDQLFGKFSSTVIFDDIAGQDIWIKVDHYICGSSIYNLFLDKPRMYFNTYYIQVVHKNGYYIKYRLMHPDFIDDLINHADISDVEDNEIEYILYGSYFNYGILDAFAVCTPLEMYTTEELVADWKQCQVQEYQEDDEGW